MGQDEILSQSELSLRLACCRQPRFRLASLCEGIFLARADATTALFLHHGNVRREIHLHGVTRSIAIALAHGLAISADGLLHFRNGWQGVVSDQIIGYPFTLQFSQRHDGAQRLQKSDEEEITELGMKHPAEEWQIVVRSGDQVWRKKGKSTLYPVQ